MTSIPTSSVSDRIIESVLGLIGICFLLVLISIFILVPAILVFDLRPSDVGIVMSLNDAGETPPPISENVFLKANEIAYCVNEKVRLTYLRDHGRKLEFVGYLAQAIDDYNMRCGQFRADPADLQISRDNAVLFQKRLYAQAEDTLEKWSELVSKFGNR